jgi:hypothetical protein
MSTLLSDAAVDKLFANKVFECDDLLCHIFDFVDSLEIVLAALVSKGWQRCVNMSASWNVLSHPLITEARWSKHSQQKLNGLFIQLVRTLSKKNCLRKVKMVRAFLKLEHLEAYQLLREHCPSFIFGSPVNGYDAAVQFGLGAGLVDAVGPYGNTLCIENDGHALKNPLPDTVRHLVLRTYVRPELIPESLESLETYSIRSLRNLQFMSTLRKLSITMATGPNLALPPMLQLQILELTTVTPAGLEKFIGACPNVESFVARLDQLDQMRDCYHLENYVELLKRWQLKTLALALEGLVAQGETRDYDTIRAYIFQKLPSLEHLELYDYRI